VKKRIRFSYSNEDNKYEELEGFRGGRGQARWLQARDLAGTAQH